MVIVVLLTSLIVKGQVITTYRTFSSTVVEYGIERINREVSYWMKGLRINDDHPQIPFIATRGYDSVVWSRLYSRDKLDLEDYQINQVLDDYVLFL